MVTTEMTCKIESYAGRAASSSRLLWCGKGAYNTKAAIVVSNDSAPCGRLPGERWPGQGCTGSALGPYSLSSAACPGWFGRNASMPAKGRPSQQWSCQLIGLLDCPAEPLETLQAGDVVLGELKSCRHTTALFAVTCCRQKRQSHRNASGPGSYIYTKGHMLKVMHTTGLQLFHKQNAVF